MPNNKLSYTNRDIVAIRKDIMKLIPTLTDKWTDYNESDLGMTYVEVLAGVVDLLGYYLDKQALETYLPTVTESKNMKALLSVVNQKPHMAIPSTCYGEFWVQTTDPDITISTIVIPKYTQVSARVSDTSIKYATSETCMIPAGGSRTSVKLIQGEKREVTMTTKNLTKQVIQLQDTTVAEGSVSVIINGEEWREVSDVFLEDEVGKIFSVSEDKNNYAVVKLSYNYEEFLPENQSAPVVITYLSTLGSKGSIITGSVNAILERLYDDDGLEVTDMLGVTNTEESSGGNDRQSLDDLKLMIPKVVRSMDKAVILDDYEVLATNYPGVLKSVALDWSVDKTLVQQPYKVDVYIVPPEGNVPSQALLDEVHNYLSERCCSGIVLSVLSAKYVDIDLRVEVEVSSDAVVAGEVRAGLISEIKSYFSPQNQEFGGSVRLSKLYALIQGYHSTIESVEIVGMTYDILVDKNQFPRLRTLNVSVTPVRSTRRYF